MWPNPDFNHARPAVVNLQCGVFFLLSLSATILQAQTYGTRAEGSAPAAGKGVYSTATTCASSGWVESSAWIELPDPALVAAASPSQGGVAAQAIALAQIQGQTGSASGHHEIRIRMADGSMRLVRQAEPMPLGLAVHWVNGRVSPQAPADSKGSKGTVPCP